jgi:pimeloyl-ACP methyl ester carboxylesterase
LVAVILLHAFPLDGTMWAGIEGRPIDYPGSGSLAEWADLVASTIDRPAVVCGLSMGGYAAFELVRRHPGKVAGLVLADTRAEPDSPEARAGRDAAVERVRSEGVAAQFEATYAALFRGAPDAAVVERALSIAVAQPPGRVIEMLLALRDRGDSRDLLAGIGVPATVICGSQDAITPPAGARVMADAIPGARYIEIADAGHLSAMEQPAAFAAAMPSA